MKPLLSIAIATKNREKYCINAIQSLLLYNDHRIEIAIADNSSTTEIKDFIENINSDQIKYIYDSNNISSIENFNRAMELTTGEYVILIGDDDTILPNAIEVTKWAKENNIDSISSKNNIIYYWPNSLPNYPNGHLIIPHHTNKIKKINVSKYLNKLMRNGLQMYLLYPLPKTYHGIVKKSILDEIKNKTGHYFGGLSPDIYSCVANSCLIKSHIEIDKPLSVAGVCIASTTADNFLGKHSGSFEDIPHLKFRKNYVFNENIPKYYSVNTIWAESGLKALEELNEVALINRFNIFYLLAQGWIHNKKYIKNIIKKENNLIRKKFEINYFIFYYLFYYNFFKIFLKKIIFVLLKKISDKKDKKINNLCDLHEVIKYCKTNLT